MDQIWVHVLIYSYWGYCLFCGKILAFIYLSTKDENRSRKSWGRSELVTNNLYQKSPTFSKSSWSISLAIIDETLNWGPDNEAHKPPLDQNQGDLNHNGRELGAKSAFFNPICLPWASIFHAVWCNIMWRTVRAEPFQIRKYNWEESHLI